MSPKPVTENTLFYGDNLPIMREYIPDESIDLVYLDPPFNSKRTYNVLFKDESGIDSEAQIAAFDDTWHWNRHAEQAYRELVTEASDHVSRMLAALREFIGTNQMMAYLVMMAIRLIELHRVLKSTGSLYIHCDPTASHYLKVVLDAVFGAENFRSEAVWKRTSAHSAAKGWGPVHDTILLYSKAGDYTWNQVYEAYSDKYITRYRYEDERGKYTTDNLTAPGIRHGSSGETWRGFNVTQKGNHWKINRKVVEALVGPTRAVEMTTTEKLDLLDDNDYIYWPSKKGGWPRFKRHLGPGILAQDVITDIPPINSQAAERLGYPTQKPIALLERIMEVSSNPSDWVLDPFCGCGTTVAAAQKLGRHWIGIDITHLSIALQRYRLQEMFPDAEFKVIGEPESVAAAQHLAHLNRHQFEWWALSLVSARPTGSKAGSKRGKKGADRGIDGVITFIDDARARPKRVLVQVKSGAVHSSHVRDLRGALTREKAAIGVLITLEEPTRDMSKEALTAGFYHSPGWQRDYPKVQILTIEQLLSGANVEMPTAWGTFKQAQRVETESSVQGKLGI